VNAIITAAANVELMQEAVEWSLFKARGIRKQMAVRIG
jgi:hypothetical protein